jgi:hypothetical protein
MSTLMHRSYRCPNTGLRVQSYACIKTADGAHEVVTCNICRSVHLIDLTTGKVLGEDKKIAALSAQRDNISRQVIDLFSGEGQVHPGMRSKD